MSRVTRCASTIVAVSAFLLGSPTPGSAAESFVSIQRVTGSRLTVLPSAGGRGRGGAANGVGRGRRRGAGATTEPTIVVVPANVKVTSAMRERRTFEFRVGVEIPGGLRNPMFRRIESPLSARIVTDARGRITEVNVITPQTDINQSNADGASGDAVIAVKPKRPPTKRP